MTASILRVVLAAGLTAAVALAEESDRPAVTLEPGQRQSLANDGATAAYSLDTNVADVVVRDGIPSIIAVAPGATSIVIITAAAMHYVPVVVLPGGAGPNRRLLNPSASAGAFESQYDSFSRRLQMIAGTTTQNGSRVTTVRLNYALLPSGGDRRARHVVPAASYRIVDRDRELTFLDDIVRSSPLTLDGRIVRGIHARRGGVRLHAGYSSFAFFNNLLLSSERRLVFGLDVTRPLGPHATVTPRLYVFPKSNAKRGTDGVVAAVDYDYRRGTELRLNAGLGLSRGLDARARLLPGGWLDVSRTGARDNASLRLLYQPDGFATLDSAIHGFRSNGVWTRRISPRLSSSMAFDANRFAFGDFRQTNENVSLGLRYSVRPRWFVTTGARQSYFESRSALLTVRSYEIPLGIEYARPAFGGTLEYRTTHSSVSDQPGNGLHASLRAQSARVSFDLYADRATQVPTLDLIFAENPGLDLALRELGLQVSTPTELARLLREHPELVDFGAIRGVNVNLSPVHYQLGSNLWWKGWGARDARLGITMNYSRDVLPSHIRESAVAGLMWSMMLTNSLNLGIHYSRFVSRSGNESWTSAGGWQFSLRQQFNEVPSFSRLFARKGTISGVVYTDPDEAGVFDASMAGIEGAEVVLDGARTMKTSRDGRFAFERVPADGHHQIEVRYTSTKPFRFTTSPIVSANVGQQVAVGIGPVAGHLSIDIRNTEGLPISNVRVSVSDGRKSVTHETSVGKLSLDLPHEGAYEVSLTAESIPAGYHLAGPATRSVTIEEGHPAEVEFQLKAMRSVAGRVRSGATAGVAGVPVSLDGGAATSTTDANGNYLFRNPTPGTHVITADVGGSTMRKEVEIPTAPGALRNIDLEIRAATPALVRIAHAQPPPVVPQAQAGNAIVVQVGTFAIAENADDLVRRLADLGIPSRRRQSGRYVVVDAGPFASASEATRIRERIRTTGVDGEAPRASRASVTPVTQGAYAVQIGVFREKQNARKAADDAEAAMYPTYMTDFHLMLVVQVGPFETRAEAIDARRELAKKKIDGLVVPVADARRTR